MKIMKRQKKEIKEALEYAKERATAYNRLSIGARKQQKSDLSKSSFLKYDKKMMSLLLMIWQLKLYSIIID